MWVKKGRLSKKFFWCKKCTQALGINNNCDNFYRNWVRPLRILFSNSHTHSLFLLRLERRDPGVWRCQDCRMSSSESYVGKYTKQKLLGKGTFGEAWLVVSNASGRCFLLFEITLLSGGEGQCLTLCIDYALLTNAIKGLTLWRSCLRWGGSRRRKTPTWPRLNIQFISHDLMTILFKHRWNVYIFRSIFCPAAIMSI